ncbi:unnamed protein product [Microthlaspi erraticum]|uniref:Uncharacterized protein n=1 Tax=Microthlaspi erraticum TaxID=1685480 RepID=A0A6D2KMD0_9BRAS|nr:unnamed protein product [Microthlaspi erraticum]
MKAYVTTEVNQNDSAATSGNVKSVHQGEKPKLNQTKPNVDPTALQRSTSVTRRQNREDKKDDCKGKTVSASYAEKGISTQNRYALLNED